MKIRALSLAAVAALLCTFMHSTSAQAWWRGGVFIGVPPVVIGPPVVAYGAPYYYAPGYYPYYYYPPPPPNGAAPQASASGQTAAPQVSQNTPPYGSMCHAGVYSCAAAPQSSVGSTCACSGIGAPSYGTVQ